MNDSVFPSEEQLAYADILFYGCWAGLAIMLVTYLLYIFGIITPHVPLEVMPQYWNKSVNHYLSVANVPAGWGWCALIGKGDFLNFIGVVLLAGLSIICYLRVLPSFFRKKDILMASIACMEILVLLFAASGIVGGGAH